MSLTQKIYLLRNADSKVPQSTDIEYGEIAIGYKANAESLFIKNTADNIVRFLPSTALMSSVTYSELVNLRSQNALIPSIYYRITDFVTVVNDNTYYKSAGHQFDLIVMATSTNTLLEECFAIKHDGDTYFNDCDLNRWQIWYCLDNDATRFTWANTTNGKGVIYRMIDEYGNDCPYDFKNIQFKRWAVSSVTKFGVEYDCFLKYSQGVQDIYYSNTAESRKIGDYITVTPSSETIYYYTFTWLTNDKEVKDLTIIGPTLPTSSNTYEGVFNNHLGPSFSDTSPKQLTLNNTVIVSTASLDNGTFYGVYGNIFGVNCLNNTLGSNARYNNIGNEMVNCFIGNSLRCNKIGDYFYNNAIGNNCSCNTIGNEDNNTFIGNNVAYNTWRNSGSYQIIGNFCYNNVFSHGCNRIVMEGGNSCNMFDTDCDEITLKQNSSDNSFGVKCQFITLADNCMANSFAPDVQYVNIPTSNVKHAKVLGGTKGSSSNILQIAFAANKSYCQTCGLNSNNALVIKNTMD